MRSTIGNDVEEIIKTSPCDLIVVAGQSNASGYGMGPGEELIIPDGIFELTDTYKTKTEGGLFPERFLFSYAHEKNDMGDVKADFATGFAVRYKKSVYCKKNRNVIIVKAAVGGTGFCRKQWGVGNFLFGHLTYMTDMALKLNPQNRIVAFLWHQGELDSVEAKTPKYDFYYSEFKQQCLTFKNRYQESDFPIICGELADGWVIAEGGEGAAEIEAAQRVVCSEMGFAAMVSAKGLLTNDQILANGDIYHFCRASQYEFGKRYFAVFNSLMIKRGKWLFNREILENFRIEIVKRLKEYHIKRIAGHEGRLLFISSEYPGFWLEHVYDAIVYAKLFPEEKDVAASQVNLFIENQRSDGKFPYFVGEVNDGGGKQKKVGYCNLQECVSFARLCLEVFEIDKSFDLERAYEACVKYDKWLKTDRMTTGKGLVESFCGYDTGHDNSGRLQDYKYKGLPDDKKEEGYPEWYPAGCAVAPVISPDVNAVYFGNKAALSEMANILGKVEDSRRYREEAEAVKKKIYEICYDKDDDYFYDADKNGNKIKVKSISNTALLCEKVLDYNDAKRFIDKHLKSDEEFYTPYPMPSVSVDDKTFAKNRTGNSWGYYSQALTALRTLRYLPYYGENGYLRYIMQSWVDAWCREGVLKFGQELDPLSGEPSDCSQWYSSCMLFILCAVNELTSRDV